MNIPPPMRSSANPSPVRRPASIRRTTSIDVIWTEGPMGPRTMEGRARDIIARGADGGDDIIRAEASMTAQISNDRAITAISADPAPAGLAKLVGERGGGHLRMVLREAVPQLIAEASPLYLLLDDISGTSLVSSWALSQWEADWLDRMIELMPPEQLAKFQDREGVCWGFRPGSSALQDRSQMTDTPMADGFELRNPADPGGWHAFPEHDGLSFRRARRIDVWREHDGSVGIEASFQDSAARREGGRAALHEYIVRASIDPVTHCIDSLEPEPRVLPFGECPGAIPNAKRLIGTPLPQIRESVLDQLRGPQGCTHLNDALRALAEVPKLLESLDEALACPA